VVPVRTLLPRLQPARSSDFVSYTHVCTYGVHEETPVPRLKKDPELFGSCKAAHYIAVHRSSLDAWRRRGEITPMVVERGPHGPRYLYSPGTLDRFREKLDYET
jgi:hypothetical protein